MNYAEIGRRVKDANPGDYDNYTDEEVGKAYAKRYGISDHEIDYNPSGPFLGLRANRLHKKVEHIAAQEAFKSAKDNLDYTKSQIPLQRARAEENATATHHERMLSHELLKETHETALKANELTAMEIEAAKHYQVDLATYRQMALEAFKATTEIQKKGELDKLELKKITAENNEHIRALEVAKQIEIKYAGLLQGNTGQADTQEEAPGSGQDTDPPREPQKDGTTDAEPKPPKRPGAW